MIQQPKTVHRQSGSAFLPAVMRVKSREFYHRMATELQCDSMEDQEISNISGDFRSPGKKALKHQNVCGCL